MIKHDKRKAMVAMSDTLSIRGIANIFNVSPTTVLQIIKQNGEMPDKSREDKIEIDPELLRSLYADCEGYVQRIHEKLSLEHNKTIGYSTLTKLLRELGIGVSRNQRCEQVPDEPGAEMQHDTTVYHVKLGDRPTKLVASIVYLRYSKIRYLKFYRTFNRFKMKCFLHEALTSIGYSAKACIIDNTNLARCVGSGTGKHAVISPEMVQFGRQYGFDFLCHEIKHSNRKAGNERSFWTTETNFLPGRTFETLEDLNRQAFNWATTIIRNRPVAKTNLIPAKAFEHEQPYLTKLSPHICPPYLEHERTTDQYGYVSFAANYYWIPGTRRDDVSVFQYDTVLKIYLKRQLLGEYELPPDGTRNAKVYPKGGSKPKHQPNNRKKSTTHEENVLRTSAMEVANYLDFVLKSNGLQKHRFILHLYRLFKNLGSQVFKRAIERAHKYRILDVKTIENIAVLEIKGKQEIPFVQVDQAFESREAYLEGKFTDDIDLTIYDKIMENPDE